MFLPDLSFPFLFIFLQRKGHFRDLKCVFFPDDVDHNGFQKVGREPSSLSSVSSARSWEKCGDSFMDSPVRKVQGVHDMIDAHNILSLPPNSHVWCNIVDARFCCRASSHQEGNCLL